MVDNANTHNTPTIHCWLLRHPRFHVHFAPTNFTPTSRSWMNLVERWFAALTEKQPRRGAHRSTPRAGGGHSTLHRHHERASEAVHVDEVGPIQDTRRGATKVAATMVAWSGLRIAMYALSDRSRYQDVQGPASGGRQGARPHQPRAGCAATRLRDRRRAGALVSRLGPTRETLRGAQRPAGFVERTDFNSVVSRLAPYLQNYTRFAYGSGWRKAEVAPLEWPAVDKTSTRSRCGAEHSKNGEPCVLPLVVSSPRSSTADGRTRTYTTVTGETAESRYIFHRNGGRIGNFRKAWTAACIAAGFAKPKLRRDGRPVLDRKGQPVMRAT